MKDDGNQPGDDLDSLKRLLFSREIDELDRLRSQIDEPELFSRRVGEVLPRAMVDSSDRGAALSEAMLPTVEEIVRLSISKDINKFADALFPVIGPAIRKSIRETFRQMMQSLNSTLEHSLSWQGFKWRFESMRTGIPFAQIALLHGLVYRVEQVFLIHRRDGLMLLHLYRDDIELQDPDLVSAMLSAINDFVGDSFAGDSGRHLDSIEVGELSIWIEAGPDAILAAAIRGEAPQGLRPVLQQTLERVQAELAGAFAGFNGDTGAFEERRDLLSDCLQARYRAVKKTSSTRSIVVMLLLLAGLGYWGYLAYQLERQRDDYVDSIEREPGYIVTRVDERDGILLVNGLRDPLARRPEVLVFAAEIAPGEVRHRFQPYQSLDARFVEQRAHRIIAPPAGVEMSLNDGQLVFSGSADRDWWQALPGRVGLIAGIDGYDDSGLRTRFSPQLLDPPSSVSLQLEDGVLLVDGAAGQEWIAGLDAAVARFPEIGSIDRRGLTNLTELELVGKMARLEREQIFFQVGTPVDVVSIDTRQLAELVDEIINLADKLSRSVLIVVKGYSDSIGVFDENRLLSLERADFVVKALLNRGIDPRYFTIRELQSPVPTERSEAERRYNRRVEFEVIVE